MATGINHPYRREMRRLRDALGVLAKDNNAGRNTLYALESIAWAVSKLASELKNDIETGDRIVEKLRKQQRVESWARVMNDEEVTSE